MLGVREDLKKPDLETALVCGFSNYALKMVLTLKNNSSSIEGDQASQRFAIS